MSILNRIAQRQASSAETVEKVAADEEAQAAQPDAELQAQEGRSAFRQQFSQMPDRELQEEVAGPEEQALHTKMEQQLVELVHSPAQGSTQALLKAVMTAQDPVQGIGFVASDLVRNLANQHPGATQDILLSIGERAVEEIVELSEVANPRFNFSEEDMAEAVAIGVQDFSASHMDQVDEAEVQEFLAQ